MVLDLPFFDLALMAGLVFLAWRVVAVRDTMTASVVFIVFGLVLALAWVRLDAPDIALAEAAIGAGLTGALFIDTVGRIRRRDAIRKSMSKNRGHGPEDSARNGPVLQGQKDRPRSGGEVSDAR